MINKSNPKPRLYYGWVIVIVAIVAGAFAPGISIWSTGILMPPMVDNFDWSRSEFMIALTIRWLTSAAISPWIGPILDQPNGPRRLMSISAAALGLSMIGLYFIDDGLIPLDLIDSRVQFYFLFGIIGGAAQMGAGMTIGQTVLPKWFIKRRGRVLGIAATGSAVGPFVFPPVVNLIVEYLGFRWAWVALGVATIVILLPLSFLVRTQPEDMGLLPDNEEIAEEEENVEKKDDEISFTRKEAMRTPTFWVLMFAFAMVGLGLSGYHTNWQAFLTEPPISFAAQTAALGVSFYAIFSMSARVIWGSLGDKYHPKKLIVIGMFGTSASILFMLTIDSLSDLLIFGIFHGLTIGSFFILEPLLIARYFGRKHLGSIFGIFRPAMMITGSLSPLMVGILYDSRGSYTLAFIIVACVWAIAASLVFLVSSPKPPQSVN